MEFDVSVITNVTREHLNIHGSYENYIECKSMLFKQCEVGILNIDSELYEAAYVDGLKNRFQEIIYVTVPNPDFGKIFVFFFIY